MKLEEQGNVTPESVLVYLSAQGYVYSEGTNYIISDLNDTQ